MKRWSYSDATYCKAGTMVCTACKKKITDGYFRYRFAKDGYKCQHRACSKDDPQWQIRDEEAREKLRIPLKATVHALSLVDKFSHEYLIELISSLKTKLKEKEDD